MSLIGQEEQRQRMTSEVVAPPSRDVVVVTRREVWRDRLQRAAAMRPQGGRFLVVESFEDALSNSLDGDGIIVLDRSVDEKILGRLPRLWREAHRDGFAALVTEVRDTMFERSALACGYRAVFALEDAMRMSFLDELVSLPPRDRSVPGASLDLQALDARPEPTLVVTTGGRILHANPAFFRRIGKLPGNPASLSLTGLFPELSASQLEKWRPRWEGLLELRRASGNTEVVRVSAEDLDPEGQGVLALRL